jgi:ParB-like chromosome segregation protein Spo0J
MSISITREERDALYERIVVRLSGIDGVFRAVDDEDWEAARKLGQEFSDLLQLVCEDLGWGEAAGERLELKTPPDVLVRAMSILADSARHDREHYEAEFRQAEESVGEARFLEETCERIVSELG